MSYQALGTRWWGVGLSQFYSFILKLPEIFMAKLILYCNIISKASMFQLKKKKERQKAHSAAIKSDCRKAHLLQCHAFEEES